MDTPGKVIRPAEIKSCVHKENNAKGKSVYDGIPENEISSREDTNVGQLPTSVHCSDYLQQTLSDLMQLNPDDFIIHGDQQRQFSHHVLQDNSSETVEDIVCGSSNVGSNLKEITGGSCSNNNSRSVDITGENNDANDIYYTHIYDCIVRDTYPEGYCESYYTALKKRARHYCVINGTLYYNRKQPREVIIKKHQQQRILQNAHIEIETGIHLGAKRMHEAINKTFFWRGMYMDIITFVRDCQKCAESFSGSHLRSSAQCKLDKTHENDNNGNFSVNNENLLDTDLGIRNGVWQKVIVKLCGPYPKTADDNEYLITIADPVSMWVCVKPTTNERNIKTVSTFIIKIFCLLGFAECCFIGFTTEELENVQQHCKEGMFESEITSCMFGSKSRQTSETELLGADECSWSTDLLNEFVNCYPSDWDTKVQSFLHTYHVSTGCDSLTPFYKLHGRNPKFILEANKENRTKDISISKVHAVFSAREKSPNSVLQIHPNSSEGTQQCETLVRDDCSLLHRKFRRKILAESHQGNAGSRTQTGTAVITERRAYFTNRNQQQSTMKINQPSEIRANTVACVKKLLESAKEKKRKRGKYHKYSPEIREQIAQYVAENGAGEAARCFSEKLGRVVSESTVRNIFKLHSNYTPDLKQEIGKYAMTYGVQAASDHFTQKLGHAIRLGIVHKFKRFYLNQMPAQLKKKIHKKRSNVNRKRHYSDELKEEIGNYAFKYTVGAAIRHYSRKFGYPITETVVRRFRKMYLQKTFDKQSQWKQKQEHLSSQQKGEQLQPEREQEHIYLNFQENHVGNQMEQTFPQNNVHERCAQSTDAASTMQTINILHSSMSVLNDPQFSDSHNDIFPCEPVALPSNCSSFDQHTNSVLDIQPYIQCSGTVVSSALVFPSQFNHLADNALVSTDPSIPVQECQYNELYSYYSELNQQRDINSVSGNNYISPQQLPALSHFSDAELAGKTLSTLNGTPTHRKQQSFHLPNSSSLATDRLVSQIHSVLSQTGDVLFQQEGIQQLTDTNTAIQLNSDPIAGQNADDIIPVSKHSGDNCQLHTSSLCYSASNVSTKTSTEYSVNTLFDDHNIFLMPHRADCNVSTYNKYNEVKAPGVPSSTSQITVSEVNATDADATNGDSYSVQCSPSTMCSLTLQPLEPVVTRDLQIHETTATLNSSPSISTLNPQTSEHQSPVSFGTSNTNVSLTQKMLKTPITPTVLGENAGTLHPKLVINMKPLTSPADVPQNPVTPISSSLLKEKQVVTSCTTSSSCSVALQNETTCSFTNHPPLVQAPVNQPTPLYTVATAASGTTTKSIASAYALPHAQVEKKKNKIPLMYFSQSQFTEPPPLVAISHSKTSVKQSPSHITLFPVASMTETFSAMDSLTKIPPLAVVSYSTSSRLRDSGQLQNSVVTYQSHSSGKQSPMHELHTTVAVSHHKKLKTVDTLDSSEKTLDQRIANQTKLSDESLVCSLDKAIMSSKSSSSNTDHIKNKFNFVQKKIPLTVAPSSSLQSVNNGIIMQNHATNSQSTPSLVVSQQISPNIEVAIIHATTAKTKPNCVENIHNTSMSSSFQNINTLAAKQNRSAPSCSLPHIVHKKIDLSSKIPEFSNLCITGTRPSASTVSVQTFVTISDLKHTATTTSTNSHVILMSSETANECRPRVSTVLTSPVTTAIPVNFVPTVTSGNVLSGAAEIPIITEYHNKQKEGMKNKYEHMTNLKHPATCRSKDEIHTSVMTLPTIQSYISVTSSNTPVMTHEVTIPCSSAVSNCTSTEGSGFTSSTLATTKSGNSSQCYTGSTCINNSSCNGINRIPSGNNLSNGATTMYFGNATTSVSTMLSNKNCSLSRSTSLDNSAEVSSSNTPAGETATSVVHCYLNNVPEICHSSTVLKLSDSSSNSKKSSTSTDTTFYYKTTGCLTNTSTSHTDTTYSSNILSNSKTTPISANNSLRCTTSISPSNGLSPGLVKGASDMTKGNKEPNHVAAKNSHKKPLSRNFKASKRGNYFVYSPELRAEMGKYAAEHGNQQACLYFKHILGVEVPSSTMRTLRDKYLLKLEHCTFDQKVLNNEVTSLGYGQRGRPMRLGKYDDEVRHCIQEIVKTGEPVSSYLVIETARQVLMQYEPSLLEENGGNIKLNVTWAKSFLKRTGIRNNS